uniref:Aryl sulfotransferase n=1 Tax=Moniliophthora roreri TaxID=221103 RepID=A0A0W0F222_MONRR
MQKLQVLVFVLLLGLVGAERAFIQNEAYEKGTFGLSPNQTFHAADYTPVQWNYVLPPANMTELQSSTGLVFMAPNGILLILPLPRLNANLEITGKDVMQRGGAIFNMDGTLVCSAAEYGATTIFQKVTYKDQDHILLWTGKLLGAGYVNPGGLLADIHDTIITPYNTAVMPVYTPTGPIDLTPHNGSSNGPIIACVIQEVDIDTGRELFTWNSLDHVDPAESYLAIGAQTIEGGWDYLHINSVDKDREGNYLISGRHTSTIYYVDGKSGEIIWRLGGKRSDFTVGEGASFSWQHHARWLGDGFISVFNNDASPFEVKANSSRGIVLAVDTDSMSVALVKEVYPFKRMLTLGQGSVQVLENGNYMVGWGQNPYFSEYDSEGNVLYSVHFGIGDVQAYRVFRYNWKGHPKTRPTLGITYHNTSGIVDVHASWNGATEIHTWELFGAEESTPLNLVSLNVTRKTDFETTISSYAGEVYSYFQVAARNVDGEYLMYSDVLGVNGTRLRVFGNRSVGALALEVDSE